LLGKVQSGSAFEQFDPFSDLYLSCHHAVHDVPAGLISINVTFAGTQIYEEVDDLCSKTSCPIKTGPIAITYVQDLPPIAPPVSAAQISSSHVMHAAVKSGNLIPWTGCCN
jgi:hypothetical protein